MLFIKIIKNKDYVVHNGSNRILDDIAKLLTDAGGAAQNLRKEADVFVRHQLEKALQKLDVVKREEFEVLKEILLKSESERKRLADKVEALEKKYSTNKDIKPKN